VSAPVPGQRFPSTEPEHEPPDWYLCSQAVLPDPLPLEFGAADLDDLELCWRWWPTMTERDACQHRTPLHSVAVAAQAPPDAPQAPSADGGPRVTLLPLANRHVGACFYCSLQVGVARGRLVEVNGHRRPAHLTREACKIARDVR
jgi:hypothetical protein